MKFLCIPYCNPARLLDVETARSLRVHDGSGSDGPFVETKEHLGGFILIEARDVEQATELAAGLPLLHLGGAELRPVWEQVADPRAHDARTA